MPYVGLIVSHLFIFVFAFIYPGLLIKIGATGLKVLFLIGATSGALCGSKRRLVGLTIPLLIGMACGAIFVILTHRNPAGEIDKRLLGTGTALIIASAGAWLAAVGAGYWTWKVSFGRKRKI